MFAYTDGTALRLVAAPELEDLAGWTEIELPEGYDPRWWFFRDGALVEDWAPFDAALHAGIDRQAGVERCRFITSIPAQALTYQRKETEARAWLAAEAPDPAGFPFLSREAAATDQTIDALAAEVAASADQWADLGSRIEAARIGAKRAVTLAVGETDKRAAAAVDWDAVLHD
jgi:hypothetical protein